MLKKRQKIIIASSLITLGLILSQSRLVSEFNRAQALVALFIGTFLISLWALWEGMNRLKVLTILTLPTLFTISMAIFLYLLRSRFLIRLPLDLIVGILVYFLLLSENVFNVAAQRTIPLYRAASTAAFIFTIITSIGLFQALHVSNFFFAERVLNPIFGASPLSLVVWNGLSVFIISFMLILPIIWSVEMEGIKMEHLVYSLVLSFIIAQVSVALSFWPIPPDSLMRSVSLGSLLFILLGISVDHFRERLSRREVYLYLGLGVFVGIMTFLTTHWTG